MKKSLGVSEWVRAEYVTGEINSPILQGFLGNFTIWFLLRLKNLNML